MSPRVFGALVYNRNVLTTKVRLFAMAVLLCGAALAQNAPQQPQVKVNYLNVCTPAEAERAEIQAALSKVPLRPQFASDFEISRGRSSMDDSSIIAGAGAQMQDEKPSSSRWVRIRREYTTGALFSNAQYAFSTSEEKVTETLAFRVRDPKDLLQISLSASVVSVDPAQAAKTDSPPDRIRIERFGKGSIVLARCPNADQAAYEPLFKSAAGIFSAYRKALKTSTTVPGDLAKVPAADAQPAPKARARKGTR